MYDLFYQRCRGVQNTGIVAGNFCRLALEGSEKDTSWSCLATSRSEGMRADRRGESSAKQPYALYAELTTLM